MQAERILPDNSLIGFSGAHMGSPFQSIRELLPFGQPANGQRTTDRIRSLIAELSSRPANEVASRLAAEVIPTINQQSNLHMRFKLLEDMRQEAERALPLLEQDVMCAALPLHKAAMASALHADNMIKAMATAYFELVSTVARRKEQDTLAHILHRAALQAASLLVRRQQLAYHASTPPSPSSWLMLHQVYRVVCGPDGLPLNGDTAPVEHQYLSALLLAYLEPNKLPRNDLAAIIACARQLAPYAAINHAANPAGTTKEACFLVRPDEGSSGYPLLRLPEGLPLTGSLTIDCSQVVEALSRNISRLPGKVIQPLLEVSPALLQSMHIALAGKGTRQYHRTRFRPRTDLIVGIDDVIGFIDGHTNTRRSVDAISRDENDARSSEWSLVDESPNGFRVRFLKGNKWQAGAGDIVALQPRESSKVHVCLVRRMASTRGRLELGLQMLSPQFSVVDLATGKAGGGQRAIFLHNLPAHGKCSGIIVRPGVLKAGQQVSLKSTGRILHRQLGKCIEANDGLEFYALEPIPD
jgi:cyclic-di-GMP-binding protein